MFKEFIITAVQKFTVGRWAKELLTTNGKILALLCNSGNWKACLQFAASLRVTQYQGLYFFTFQSVQKGSRR